MAADYRLLGEKSREQGRCVRTFAIVNQKGGCGKTTTAINLAASFARLGRRTLLVDMDPQGHCAVGLGVPEENLDLHIGDALLLPEERPLDEGRLLWRVGRNLELAPSNVRLAGLEAASGGLAGREDRDRRLAALLRRLRQRFDVCLVDCPPTIGLLTYNALRAADEALIPVETGFFAMRGAERQVRTIRSLARRLGGQTPHRLLATMHKPGEPLAEELLASLKQALDEGVIPLVIRYDAKLREAASLGRPLLEYEPTAVGAQDYADLAAWLLTNPASPTRTSDFGQSGWAASLWSAPVREDVERSGDSSTPAADAQSRERPSLLDPRDLARTAHLLARSHDAGDGSSASSPAEQAPATPSPASSAVPPKMSPPSDARSTVSRAADLATRARLLAARSAQLQARLQGSSEASNSDARAIEQPQQRDQQLKHTSAPAPEAQRLLGARETGAGVLFVHPAPATATVCVAGDFNDWSPDAAPLRFNPQLGVHEACVPLPPGRREYRLVVNGRWLADPHNPAASGERNSVVIVTRADHASVAEAAD